ncbi:TolB family protein [Demequina rhizosphaerae]|uniref:TolB family protein n=1 Tax=Demequina rhizosphaerae TaxID=1638985 RepID=UPI0007807327|nr:hypothetical protein [Demequina rhizosphaerae]
MTDDRAGWLTALKAPKVWIPAAAAVTVIAVSVGLIVTATARRDDAVAAVGASSGPTPSASATASVGDPDVVVAAAESPTPSPSPSVSPSASVGPEPSPSAEVADGAAEPADEAEPEVDFSTVTILNGSSRCQARAQDTEDMATRTKVKAHGGSTPAASDATHTLVGPSAAKNNNVDEIFWAPDSAHVALTGWKFGVVIVDTSGRKVKVTRDGQPYESLSPVRWAPDGSALLFVGKVDGRHVLYSADPETGESTELLRANRINGYDISPATGELAVGLSDTDAVDRMSAEGTRLVVVDLASGTRTDLGSGGWPAWSPDGATIAAFDSTGSILVDRASEARTRITQGDPYDGYLLGYWDVLTPAWSQDGAYVAAVGVSPESDHWTTVVVADADGTVVMDRVANVLYRMTWTDGGQVLAGGHGHYGTRVLDPVTRTTVERRSWTAVVAGDGIALRSPLCGQVEFGSVIADPTFETARGVDVGDGWLDAALPIVSPDGTLAIQMLAGPGSGAQALYLMEWTA